MLTTVAIPYQVYQLTGSTLASVSSASPR
jgi:hypothetical protein